METTSTSNAAVDAASVALNSALSPYFVRTGDEDSIQRGRGKKPLPVPAIGRPADAVEFSFLAAVQTPRGKVRPKKEAITSWIRNVLKPSTTAAKGLGPGFIALLQPFPLRATERGYGNTLSDGMAFMTEETDDSLFIYTAASAELPALAADKTIEVADASRSVRDAIRRLQRHIKSTESASTHFRDAVNDVVHELLRKDSIVSSTRMLVGNVIDAEISNATVQRPGSFLGASALSAYGKAVDSALRELGLTGISTQYPLETGYPQYGVRHTPEDVPAYLNGRADLILATDDESGHFVVADIKTKTSGFSSKSGGSSYPGADLASVLQVYLYAYALALRSKRRIKHILIIAPDVYGGKLYVQSVSFEPQLLTSRIYDWQTTPVLTSGYDTAILERLRKEVVLLDGEEEEEDEELETAFAKLKT